MDLIFYGYRRLNKVLNFFLWLETPQQGLENFEMADVGSEGDFESGDDQVVTWSQKMIRGVPDSGNDQGMS